MRHFAHNIGDYAAATAHLSFVEDAAYHRLLRRYYQDEKPLPPDLASCARLVGARTKEEKQAVANVLTEFFEIEQDGYHQRRADREIAVYRSKAKDGARGAESRWGTPKERAAKTRSQRLSAARAKATHTPDEWAAVIEVFGGKCVKCGTPRNDLIGGTICKDHVVGIRNGGDDGVWNLQPMCRPCNTAKGQDGDFRGNVLPDWRERLAKRLAKCLATTPHSPLTNSDPNGSGGKPPTAKEKIFQKCLPLISERAGKDCRAFIGKFLSDIGNDDDALVTLERCIAVEPVDPIAWLSKQIQPRETWNERRIRLGMEAISK